MEYNTPSRPKLLSKIDQVARVDCQWMPPTRVATSYDLKEVVGMHELLGFKNMFFSPSICPCVSYFLWWHVNP